MLGTGYSLGCIVALVLNLIIPLEADDVKLPTAAVDETAHDDEVNQDPAAAPATALADAKVEDLEMTPARAPVAEEA